MLIRNFLLKEGLLYLENFTPTKEPFPQFVNNLINKYLKEHDTYYKNTNLIQCLACKARSLGDLWLICKSYYPNITLRKLKKVLVILTEDGNIGSLHCGNIDKRTYYAKNKYASLVVDDINKDELGMSFYDIDFNKHIEGYLPVDSRFNKYRNEKEINEYKAKRTW